MNYHFRQFRAKEYSLYRFYDYAPIVALLMGKFPEDSRRQKMGKIHENISRNIPQKIFQ